MSQLLIPGKHLDWDNLEILLEDDFSSVSSWVKDGDIAITADKGVLELKWQSGGRLCHGQLFSKPEFPAEVIMDFEAETVPPSANDIIWWWNVRMNRQQDHWKSGYLGALGGWFTNQAGIEKISRTRCRTARTPLLRLEPGKRYHIQSGMIAGIGFMIVDGQLILELEAPTKGGTGSGRIGFGVYQSHFKIRNLKVLGTRHQTKK